LERTADQSAARRELSTAALGGRVHPGDGSPAVSWPVVLHPGAGIRPVAWQIGLRWWVPPAILLALLVSRWLGFEAPALHILLVAVAILVYNAALAWACRRWRGDGAHASILGRWLAIISVGLDYAALLILIGLTGGTGSPLLPFLVFHVVLAATLLSSALAYLFASLAALGLAVLALGSNLGWWATHSVRFRGLTVMQPGPAAEQIVLIIFYAAAVLIVAALATSIMAVLRRHVAALEQAGREIAAESAHARETMERQILERTRFMLQVAHNLRAPLNASLSMLDVISEGYAGEVAPEQQDYLTRIGTRLRRLSESIGELLSIAQTQAQGREFVPVAVDPRTLAADVERTFRDSAAGKRLQLAVSVADGLQELRGDADMLLQMVENLVSNAIKYTPPGGEVSVRFEPGGTDCWRIVVADTGIGIPQAEQSRLFTEFFRASNARRLEEVGTGLGLALVKQTAEWHGGAVLLESTEGQGTRVTVELPCAGPGRPSDSIR